MCFGEKMNITDFLKEKKKLDDESLMAIEGIIDDRVSKGVGFSIENHYDKMLRITAASHHYLGFDMSFLKQSRKFSFHTGSIILPKYSAYLLDSKFHVSSIMVSSNSFSIYYIIFNYNNSQRENNPKRCSYPNLIYNAMEQAMINSEFSISREFVPCGVVDLYGDTRKLWKHHSKSLRFHSTISIMLDKESRQIVTDSMRYFHEGSLFAIAEASWVIGEAVPDERCNHNTLPIIRVLDDNAFLITEAKLLNDYVESLAVKKPVNQTSSLTDGVVQNQLRIGVQPEPM